MRAHTWYLGGLALLFAATASATPTLVGATVQLQHLSYGSDGTFLGSFDLGSTTVGSGIEFTNGVEPEVFDVAAASITISQDPASFVEFFPNEFDEHILTFSGGAGVTIQSATLQPGHGVSNLTQGNVSLGPDFVSVVWAGTEWDGPEVVSLNLTLIPEPSTAFLMGIGLVGVAMRRRKRETPVELEGECRWSRSASRKA